MIVDQGSQVTGIAYQSPICAQLFKPIFCVKGAQRDKIIIKNVYKYLCVIKANTKMTINILKHRCWG